jgi:hypothetical protein
MRKRKRKERKNYLDKLTISNCKVIGWEINVLGAILIESIFNSQSLEKKSELKTRKPCNFITLAAE